MRPDASPTTAVPGHGRAPGPNRRRLRLGGLALFLALALHPLPAAAAGSSGIDADKREPVLRFQGDKGLLVDTTPFTIAEGPWQVVWHSDAQRLEIKLLQTGSDIPIIVANMLDPGSGSQNIVRGGTFRFAVRAYGPWRIEVYQPPIWTRGDAAGAAPRSSAAPR